MTSAQFATAINCMDGRVMLPVINFIRKKHQVLYVDMITEPGPTKWIINATEAQKDLLKQKIQISYEAHGSETIAIVGHHECAGNPTMREEKIIQIRKAVEIVKSWGFPMQVYGLYVNEYWEVEEI
jgi:hypothetical protein